MASGYKFPIRDSGGSATGTIVDMEDMFVDKRQFSDPILWSWGNNENGRLGLGDTTNRSNPTAVGTSLDWNQISAGYSISSAVKKNGTLWVWGRNGYGQLGQNNTTAYSSPVQVGTLTDWSKVIASFHSNFGIKTDGTLWAWGVNTNGKLGQGNTTHRSSPVQVGSLTDWNSTSPISTMHAPNSMAIIKGDGTLWTWGNNFLGGLGLNDTIHRSSPVQVGTLTNWKMVSTGNSGFYTRTYAIKTDGTLWAWGANYGAGELGLNNTTNYSSPVQVGTLTNWKQVSASGGGDRFAAAVKTDGTLWTWGGNAYGELGLNNRTAYSSPVQVGILTNWKMVSCGYTHTAAIKTDGTLWAWGYNVYGELGLGNTNQYSSPVQVGSLTDWKSLISGTSAGARGYVLAFRYYNY